MDLNTWNSDDFAERPDVLAAMIEVMEEAGALSVCREGHPTFRDNLARLRAAADKVYEVARREPAQ